MSETVTFAQYLAAKLIAMAMTIVYLAPDCELVVVLDETLLCASGSKYDFNPTKDYYGMHGEFDSNDESRRASEDIQGFHKLFPDEDLSDHYYWEDVLDAETDGYLDD